MDNHEVSIFGQIEQERFKTIPRTPVDDARLRELAEGFRSESYKPEAGSAEWWRDVAQGLAAEVGLLRAEVAALRQSPAPPAPVEETMDDTARLRGLVFRALEIFGAQPMAADSRIDDPDWEDEARAALLQSAPDARRDCQTCEWSDGVSDYGYVDAPKLRSTCHWLPGVSVTLPFYCSKWQAPAPDAGEGSR